jgi:hypothetical protein
MGAISKAFPPHGRKPMSAEVRDVKRLLNELEGFNLTNWEIEFVADLLDKVALYAGGFRMTTAQEDCLNRLAVKYDLDPA